MSEISAVVITRNEARNIERCLSSLDFCNDIVVVDSNSTDNTLEIASQFTSRVYVRPWSGYADQKNFAVNQARNDWVLSIDADEEVSPELRDEILGMRLSSNSVAFSVPRKTMHSGRWIRHGGWYPNRLVRFFKKSEGNWVGTEIHERWETPGTVGELSGHLHHYSFASLSDQVIRNNTYSSLGALALQRAGVRFSTLKLVTKPIWKFIETYLVKRGFLDGYPGFIISVSAAYSVFLKWAKLWECEREQIEKKKE